jgi:ribosomal-protein-alanine N-acetyltransferase
VTELRPLIPADVPAITRLYGQAFEIPWQATTLQKLLQYGAAGLVLCNASSLQGFILWRVAADEAEIITLAVAPACRRKGHATRLLQEMLHHLRPMGIGHIYLEVRASQSGALQLYRRAGFIPHGQRRGYYTKADGTQEDAILMTHRLVPNSKAR